MNVPGEWEQRQVSFSSGGIIHLLVVEGEAGLTLAELAQRLNAKPGAIRRQLRVLEGQDMLELVCPMSPPRYRPRRDIFRDLLDYVSAARSGPGWSGIPLAQLLLASPIGEPSLLARAWLQLGRAWIARMGASGLSRKRPGRWDCVARLS